MRYCMKCGNELPKEAKFCPKCGTAVAAEQALTTTVPAGSKTCSDFKLAFWWERFVAWLIDIVLFGIVTSILSLLTVLSGFPFNFSLVPGWPNWLPFFNFNLNGVILFLYWVFTESVYGQSLGKMMMRIKITRLDGSPIAVAGAAVESIGKAFLLPLDVLLGWLLYPRCRQRAFNFISQTIVIKAK